MDSVQLAAAAASTMQTSSKRRTVGGADLSTKRAKANGEHTTKKGSIFSSAAPACTASAATNAANISSLPSVPNSGPWTYPTTFPMMPMGAMSMCFPNPFLPPFVMPPFWVPGAVPPAMFPAAAPAMASCLPFAAASMTNSAAAQQMQALANPAAMATALMQQASVPGFNMMAMPGVAGANLQLPLPASMSQQPQAAQPSPAPASLLSKPSSTSAESQKSPSPSSSDNSGTCIGPCQLTSATSIPVRPASANSMDVSLPMSPASADAYEPVMDDEEFESFINSFLGTVDGDKQGAAANVAEQIKQDGGSSESSLASGSPAPSLVSTPSGPCFPASCDFLAGLADQQPLGLKLTKDDSLLDLLSFEMEKQGPADILMV